MEKQAEAQRAPCELTLGEHCGKASFHLILLYINKLLAMEEMGTLFMRNPVFFLPKNSYLDGHLYQFPLFSMEAHGSLTGNLSPSCSSSMEI